MSEYDHRAQRLFVAASLAVGQVIAVPAESLNYLLNVLRLRTGAGVHIFNGRDGEFRAVLRLEGKRTAHFEVLTQLREQSQRPSLDYCFAPLKQARLDYMVQKATEMGVGCLRPIITSYTQIRKVNMDRLRANVIEAAEQCGVLAVPELFSPVSLPDFLEALPPQTLFVFCDEKAKTGNPFNSLSGHFAARVSLIIGPEGGFDDQERQLILSYPNVVRLSLGPRILRADTAAVAALTIVQAALGDWGDAS